MIRASFQVIVKRSPNVEIWTLLIVSPRDIFANEGGAHSLSSISRYVGRRCVGHRGVPARAGVHSGSTMTNAVVKDSGRQERGVSDTQGTYSTRS